MSNESKDIEERLIPYIEGVLNPREQEEVETAVSEDPDLARDVDELREVVADLREAFASGVKLPQAELTSEEVCRLAEHDGGVESIPGSPELKAKLFMNDQALAEYELLRALAEDEKQQTLFVDDVPDMPESLLEEIRRLKPQSKVVSIHSHKKRSAWKRAVGWLDSLDARRLSATAAAFVLVSFGVHFYTNSGPADSAGTASTEIAYSQPEKASEGGESLGSRESTDGDKADTDAVAGKAGPKPATIQPSGVTVFTSSDRALLKEQAEKLLANDVRYTVTEDKILVSAKEVDNAKNVLWGKEAAKIAMAEKQPKARLSPRPPEPKFAASPSFKKVEPPVAGVSSKRRASKVASAPKASTMKEIPAYRPSPKKSSGRKANKGVLQVYDGRSASKKGVQGKEVPSYDPKRKMGQIAQNEPKEEFKSGNSALKAKSKAPLEARKDDAAQKQQERNVALEQDQTAGGMTTNSSSDLRRQKLRDLALGKDTPEPAQDVIETEEEVSDEIDRTTITRSRVSKPAPPVVKQAPVANAVTADKAVEPTQGEGYAVEAGGGSVARAEVSDNDGNDSGWEGVPPVNEPGSVAEKSGPSSQGARSNSRSKAAPAPAVKPKPPSPARTSSGDADFRVASIRSSQATVARRHNVVLSVESRGSKINVYVRPKKKLTKEESEQLRKAIRAELGLAPQDSIIIR